MRSLASARPFLRKKIACSDSNVSLQYVVKLGADANVFSVLIVNTWTPVSPRISPSAQPKLAVDWRPGAGGSSVSHDLTAALSSSCRTRSLSAAATTTSGLRTFSKGCWGNFRRPSPCSIPTNPTTPSCKVTLSVSFQICKEIEKCYLFIVICSFFFGF